MDLAVKHRPKYFNEVVGQSHVTEILESQIKNSNIAHAYIFAGPSGDGKTTTARIFANTLNNNGGGIIEIDGASNNGIENIRELRDSCQFKPIGTPYKIYIIDECHMLSTGAFNGLLKTLEEPPSHCIFIMCTTDPHKIPATILSRCQRFDFRRISDYDIEQRLKAIIDMENGELIEAKCGSIDAMVDIEWAKKEGIDVIDCDTSVVEYIARLADGGMRSGITLLDTCLNYPGDLDLEVISNILGVSSHNTLFDLYKSVAFRQGTTEGIVNIIESESRKGRDLKVLFKQLLEFSIDICKFLTTGDLTITKIPSDMIHKIQDEFAEWGLEDFLNVTDKLIDVGNSIKYETDIKTILIGELITLWR